jgi:hypothetical protein
MDDFTPTAPWAVSGTAGFSFDTGFGQVDPYTTFGAGSYTGVLSDVSNGSPPEQPYTPTGNGTGVFLDSGSQKGIFDVLGQALNYAIVRDQQKMTAVYGPGINMTPQQQAALSVQASGNSRLLMYLLIGAGIWMAVRK